VAALLHAAGIDAAPLAPFGRLFAIP